MREWKGIGRRRKKNELNMIMLIYANYKDEIFYQKFRSENDMNNFIEENEIIYLGSKLLN